jgi:hypothetical protein
LHDDVDVDDDNDDTSGCITSSAGISRAPAFLILSHKI